MTRSWQVWKRQSRQPDSGFSLFHPHAACVCFCPAVRRAQPWRTCVSAAGTIIPPWKGPGCRGADIASWRRHPHPALPSMPVKPEIGSCSQAEEFFLEIAHGKVRRGGQVNIFVDAQRRPLLVEKIGLGESHSAMLVASADDLRCGSRTRFPRGAAPPRGRRTHRPSPAWAGVATECIGAGALPAHQHAVGRAATSRPRLWHAVPPPDAGQYDVAPIHHAG